MVHWHKFNENNKFHCVDYIAGRNHIAETAEILTFDIETTSIWNIDGQITSYKDCYSEILSYKYENMWNKDDKV